MKRVPTPLLSVAGLRAGFVTGRGVLPAVDGVSFELAAGQTLALLGESGCGKSMTALSIMRLLPAGGRLLGGTVRFAGEDVFSLPEAKMRSLRGRGMAMIFQEPATSLNPVMTLGQQIGEVLARHAGISGDAMRGRTIELLDAVGISDASRRLAEYPFQISGGMKQRIMIAMALAGNPQLLIADEPTTALDVTIQAQILDLLRRLQGERATGLLLITHDLGVVARMAHRVAVMYAGQIVEEAPRDIFFSSPGHPYTRALFASLPDLASPAVPLLTIPGQVPSPGFIHAGCRFADRCSQVKALCRCESPDWHTLAEGHRVRCHFAITVPLPVVSPHRHAATAVEGPVSGAQAPLLAVNGLRVHFPIRQGVLQRQVGAVRAVDGVSFSLARGRTLALVGESGCGKTTVGKAILQLLHVRDGQILFDGRDLCGLGEAAIRPLRRRMQMVFQDPFASLNPRHSVREILCEGVNALGAAPPGDTCEAALGVLLGQVGLDPDALSRYPHEFSGGQRQRIAIARAIAVQPELIVCDEPTSALDVSVQAQILNLLRQLQDSLGLAYLFITHNFAVVHYLAHEVAVMYLGRIVEQGQCSEVLRAPGHPYTRELLSAVPRPSLDPGPPTRLLSGEMPSAARPPSGCPFHPRCPRVEAHCRSVFPEARLISSSHFVYCHFPLE